MRLRSRLWRPGESRLWRPADGIPQVAPPRGVSPWLRAEWERRGWDLADLERMAAVDNVAITAGSGTSIRTLDRSAVQTQLVGIDIAQSGGAELLGLGDSRYTALTSAGVTTASTAYAIGDQIGTEITATSFTRTAKGTIIQSGVAIDKAKVMGAFDVFVFAAATTPASDNAANSWSDADMLNCLGVIHFNDVLTSANNFVIMATNLPLVVKPNSSTSLFFDFVTRTANSFFGAAGDLVVNLGISQD